MTSEFGDAVLQVQDGRSVIEVAEELYADLEDDERLWLLDGDSEFWAGLASMRIDGYNRVPIVHGAVSRLGLPGTRFVDGPRGCVAGAATAFPVSMARGATWDVELEERVGDVIGREIRALGGNFFGGVCINLPRHPAWGRAQETYGDDSFHLGEFGAALTRGTQRWVMACAKHYALNSMENARFTVDVTADEPVLHDVYLPHFARCVDQGVAAIMGSYNSVNGEWCGQNPYLLTTVLRDLWGWDGITVTDFIWGLRDGAKSLNAGMDLEEPFRQQRAQHLRAQLEADETNWDMVGRAGVRLIAAQLRSYATREKADPPLDVLANDEARTLARTVAARAMVLLKNDDVLVTRVTQDPSEAKVTVRGVPDRAGIAAPLFRTLADKSVHVDVVVQNSSASGTTEVSFTVSQADLDVAVETARAYADELGSSGQPLLPLDPASVGSIALIGRLANEPNMGDHGSSDVRPPSKVTPLDGLRAAFPGADVRLVDSDDVEAARAAAADADVAIVVAGYDARDEGEYTGPDMGASSELMAAFPPVPDDMAKALGEAFSSGEDDRASGGDRLSLELRPVDEEIIGAVAAANPSTVVALVAAGAVVTEGWRADVPAVLMMWYAGMEGGHALADVLTGVHNPSGRLPFSIPTSTEHLPFFDRAATTITYDRFHGQRLLDKLGVAAAFPHGFGLSYTTFAIRSASVAAGGEGEPALRVEVANTGGRDGGHVIQVYGRTSTGPYRGETMLVGFAPVNVAAGATVTVDVPVSLLALAVWDSASRQRVLPDPGTVELEVGAHAHDPDAVLLQLTDA